MFQEVKVKVDNEQKLKNLKELAERAKESNDSKMAAKYYEQILIEEPNNWRANFYSVYYSACNIKIAEIANAANRLSNNIEPVFKLILTQEPKENYMKACDEITSKLLSFYTLVYSNVADSLSRVSSYDYAKSFYTERVGAVSVMIANLVCKQCEYFDDVNYNMLNDILSVIERGLNSGFSVGNDIVMIKSQVVKIKEMLKVKKYWSEHADEKNKLEKEKKETINKQKEIMGKLENDPRYKEFNQIMKEIEETKKEKEKLLIFKFKEKKLLDEKIKELDEKSNEVLQPIKYLMDELIKLQGRVNEINEELTKDR